MGIDPLRGIRILDLTNVLAGPFACHQLAHLGAEVIKVEAVGRGDLARQLGADIELSTANMGISFLAQNPGKQSVTLNLKAPEGPEILGRLVESADVLVENFRPGVMDRLKVGYETLKARNPQLIYCAISGFGQDGPLAKNPAYDQIVQGMSGAMDITGTDESGPLRAGFPVADTIGGLTAAMAIGAALNAKPRGAYIDVSMLEATLATLGWAVSNYLIGGVEPGRKGNENMTSAPSGTFETGEGLLNIAANKAEQWEILVRHLGREDLREDPRFLTREHRKRNRFLLRGELEQSLAAKPAQIWADELNALGVPAGAVLSVPQVLAHPQIATRGMIADFPDAPGTGRDLRLLRTGMKIDGTAPAVKDPPPQLGQHNAQVYGSLGYSAEDLARWETEGVI
ncbi:MAG: CaiB/BaiF CoA transferase family protein [Mangrovicoccus sp.]